MNNSPNPKEKPCHSLRWTKVVLGPDSVTSLPAADAVTVFGHVEVSSQNVDLGRGDARIVEPDHEVVGNASFGEGFEQQVCTVVLGSAHQEAGSLDCPVHLSHHTTLFDHMFPDSCCCSVPR